MCDGRVVLDEVALRGRDDCIELSPITRVNPMMFELVDILSSGEVPQPQLVATIDDDDVHVSVGDVGRVDTINLPEPIEAKLVLHLQYSQPINGQSAL